MMLESANIQRTDLYLVSFKGKKNYGAPMKPSELFCFKDTKTFAALLAACYKKIPTGKCDSYYTLNVRSRGNPDPEEFCFPKTPDVSRDKVEESIRTRGKTKLTGSLRDLTLSILLYF